MLNACPKHAKIFYLLDCCTPHPGNVMQMKHEYIVPSIDPSIHLSIHLSIDLSIDLSLYIHPSTLLSIHWISRYPVQGSILWKKNHGRLNLLSVKHYPILGNLDVMEEQRQRLSSSYFNVQEFKTMLKLAPILSSTRHRIFDFPVRWGNIPCVPVRVAERFDVVHNHSIK